MKENNAQNAPSITIDELALMVKKGFDEMGDRFAELRRDLDQTNATLEAFVQSTNKSFEAVDKRFDVVDAKFDSFEARHESLEKVVIQDHAPRLKRLERKVQII
ncbi:MAG: hypothetical protein WCT02_00485 [Candidatus Paceibacterota bacterium]|jgi:DNA anti-recombination protein RmuC